MSRKQPRTAPPADVRVLPDPSALDAAARRHRNVTFAWIAGLGLMTRVLHLLAARDVPLFEHLIVDARQYDLWATRIAHGDWLGSETFYQAPLYPYFLALVKLLVGDGTWPIRIVQALMGAASCGLLFLAARNFVSHRVGVVAGVLLASYPPAIFYDGIVQKASLGGLLVVTLLWWFSRLQKSPSPREWIAAGATTGLLLLTREETILWLAPIAIWIAFRFSDVAWARRAVFAASFALGLVLPLGPVAWRNHHVGGEFVLTTSQAGPNFWIGNRPGADGRYAPLRPGRSNTPFERADAVELAELESGRKLSPNEVSSFWFGQARAWISDHPGDWLRLLGRKALLLVNWYEVPDAEDLYFYERGEPLLAFVSRILHLGVLLPLAVAGIVLSWARRRDVGIVAGVLLVQCAAVVAFYVMGRYRYPIVPPTIVFAAVALVQGFALVRVGAWRSIALPLACALPVAVVSNWPLYSRDDQAAMSHVNAGSALRASGRLPEAEAQYRAALALDDDLPEGWSNLGEVLAQQGRLSEGLECVRKAVKQRPDDARLQQRLGTALYESGDVEGAISALTRSTQLFAADPEAWNNLTFIHVARKNWAAAIDAARRGATANPDEGVLLVRLADLLARCPDEKLCDGAEALRIATRLDEATRHADPYFMELVASALARSGRHAEAHERALAAAERADAVGAHDLASSIRRRAELYAAGRPAVITEDDP